MSRKRQYGGQTENQPVNNIQKLQSNVNALKSLAEQRRAEYNAAAANVAAASTALVTAEMEEASKKENFQIKSEANTKATLLQTEKQKNYNDAVTAKTTAEANLKKIENEESTIREQVTKAQKDLNDASAEESRLRNEQNSLRVKKAEKEAEVLALKKNVNTADEVLKKKQSEAADIENQEAKNYDPSLVDNCKAWFDASKLTGGVQTQITSWTSSPTALEIISPPSFSGTATISATSSGMKTVSLTVNNTLSLTPLTLPEFTMFVVCRHLNTKSAILRGSDTSKTIYGYTTNKQRYFSIGNSENSATSTAADTNWSVLCFYRDADKRAGFWSNGSSVLEYINTTAGFDGLFVNTGGFANLKSDCEIAEIVLYEKMVPLDIQRRLEGLLARKWGLLTSLPETHPFKKDFPDITGMTGGKRKHRRHKKRHVVKRKTKKLRKAKKRRNTRR